MQIKSSKTDIVFLCTLFFFGNYCVAQDEKEAFHPRHQLALIISHAHIFEGVDEDGNKDALSLPAWGIDYTFHINEKWAIGLHTDIIIEKFKVEKNLDNEEDNETIERSYPVAPAVMGIYKLNEQLSFLLGMGGEFAKEENYVITRAGIEYGYKLVKDWEIVGSFGYDFKWNAYDTWTIGLGISKKLSKKQ